MTLRNRHERRAAAAYTRKHANDYPAILTEVPREDWPAGYVIALPLHIYRSREFLVQEFPEKPLNGNECRRLTVSRVVIQGNGDWEEEIDWATLMRVKREIGYAEKYAVEIFPRDSDVVNVANMRHLWLFERPLALGWFSVRV